MSHSGDIDVKEGGEERVGGYYGNSGLKPPVWTWEIPLYFFIGGAAGMAAVIAFGALVTVAASAMARAPLSPTIAAAPEIARHALWIAAAGAVLSPVLLVADLGRPTRFLNMLRVFKWRSAMSVGAWTLCVFGGAASLSLAVSEGLAHGVLALSNAAGIFLLLATTAAALSGAVLATYTGVLLGATAVPVWNTHRFLLPAHFGTVGLGSAACCLTLIGPRAAPLYWLAVIAAAVESALWLEMELTRHGARDRAARVGQSGAMIRLSASMTGPLSFGLRIVNMEMLAAVVFLAGAMLGRYAWVHAGQVSAKDPEAALGT